MNSRHWIGAGLLLALTLVLPFVAGSYWTGLITQIYNFGLLALAVDLLLGHTGLMSVCHAAFFSVAAYTTAMTTADWVCPGGSSLPVTW